jgi:hypothetical protein
MRVKSRTATCPRAAAPGTGPHDALRSFRALPRAPGGLSLAVELEMVAVCDTCR